MNNKKIFFWIVFASMIVLLNFIGNINELIKLKDNDSEALKDPNDIKYILFWTEFFQWKNWKLKQDISDQKFFEDIRCPETRCVITSDKNLMKIDEFDGILFHAVKPWNTNPVKRNHRQIYIAGMLESPERTESNLKLYDNFFNMTMTYRLDSDVPWIYGGFIDLESGKLIHPYEDYVWKSPDDDFFDKEILNMSKQKTKDVAWFLSHCDSVSKRNEMNRALQKYINVDIYGGCGPFKCPMGSNECDNILKNQYRFYAAYENSLCKDYITEKMFNNMKNDLIPIVYGESNYKVYAPPKSYIDVNDFETVKDLADYLIYLRENPKEYVKYFWWRKHYKVLDDYELYNITYCSLCQKMHEPGIQDRPKVYESIYNWWFDKTCHRTPKIKF